MRGMRRLSVIAVAVAVAATMATPAAAVGAFAPAETVVNADCRAESVSGDAVRDARGVTRGFVSFEGGTCGSQRPIRWFAGAGDRWRRGATPYRGVVMAAATDGDSAVVLFANGNGTFLGRRQADGGFSGARRLSASGLTGAVIPSGDVIAAGGRFWAVWNEQVGPGGEFAQTELFQSQNIGEGHYFDGVMPRTRITRSDLGDDFPTLVAEPSGRSAQTYALAWSRNDGAQGAASAIWFARATADGRWSKTRFATQGYNTAPDLFANSRATWLTWTRDGSPAVARRTEAGWGAGKVFDARRAFDPLVSAGGGHTFVAWTAPRSRDVIVAESDEGTWTVRNVTPDTPRARELLAVTTAQGKATVLFAQPGAGRVVARTQR